MSQTVVLIDGKNFGFKNAYAHISLRNSRGVPTGMFHGGLSSILKLVRVFPGAAIVFCWDGLGDTWRHRTPPFLYKANRKREGEKPPEVKAAFSQFKMFASIMHNVLKFKYLRFDNVEADDLIGLATTALVAKNRDVVIVSSDMDFYQLVRSNVFVYNADTVYTSKMVFDTFGVETHHWLDYRALTGDASDNLPGAPGIGPVKARAALALGIKPALPWDKQPKDVKSKYAKLEASWDTVLYCWRMSKIAVDPSQLSGSDGVKCPDRVEEKLAEIVKNPYRDSYTQNDYEKFIQFLGEYELEYHLKNRNAWWKIK
jgi:DNA polymerase-1